MPRGECRDSGGWVLVNFDDRFIMPMHRSDYEGHGYKPTFEALPLRNAHRRQSDASRGRKPN
jgi:hypothetical protein